MTTEHAHERLTTQDASFLYIERPHQPMHGNGIYLYEGQLSGDDVREHFEQRLHLIPRYRQRVVFPPFNIAHPTWEDDPNFDIRNHVVEDTLPAPGDKRALERYSTSLLVPPLPRDRPLWKFIVLRGSADGNTPIVMLGHHAMMDGASGMAFAEVLNDLKADAAPPPPPTSPWQPAPLPDPLTLLQNAVRTQYVEAAQRWTDETFRGLRPAEAAARAQQLTAAMSSMPNALQPAARTPFNGQLSAERDGAWADYSFADFRAIRGALGGTVNDVVLAVVAGALGRYLRHHNYPTEGVELRAMVPVSMHRPGAREIQGNQVSMILAPLYVGIADPAKRLQAEREATERLKKQDQAGAFYTMAQQGDTTPPWVQAFTGQMESTNTLYNTVVTNMPGPQIPLYMRGHRMLIMSGFGMLSPNIGLFHTVGSYNGQMYIAATVDPRQAPDVTFYANCLEEAFAELKQAAQAVAQPVQPSMASTPSTRRG